VFEQVFGQEFVTYWTYQTVGKILLERLKILQVTVRISY